MLKTKKEDNFEILQACQTYPPGYCGSILKKLTSIPLITRAGGADIQELPDINYGMRRNPIIEKKIIFALKTSDSIVAISNMIKQQVLKLGIFEEKVQVIPNGIDLNRFNTKIEANLREKYNIPLNNLIILTVGRYHRVKDFENLIYALKAVDQEFKEFSCFIIGRGNNILLDLVKKLDLTLKITIIDESTAPNKALNFNKIPSDQIISFYLQSDIYVSTSLLEGFQTTNLEALAAGLPLLLTDKSRKFGWTNAYLIQNKNGFLIPPSNTKELKDKLLLLLTDAKLRKSMGAESKKLSVNFSWNQIAKSYLKLYDTISKAY